MPAGNPRWFDRSSRPESQAPLAAVRPTGSRPYDREAATTLSPSGPTFRFALSDRFRRP